MDIKRWNNKKYIADKIRNKMIEKVYYRKLLLNFADFLSGKPKHSVDVESSSQDDSDNDTSLLAHPNNECNNFLV